MKKIFLLILTTFYIMIFFNTVNIKAASTDKFEINLEYGYDNYFRYGDYIPVKMNVVSNFDDFDGEVKLQFHINNENDGVISQHISLEKGKEKVVKFLIPCADENLSLIKSKIIKDDKVVEEHKFNIPIGKGVRDEELMIGILTDDYDALNYIPSEYVKIKLTQNNFPENIFASKMINIIIINNFDMSRLSERQIKTLKTWVEDGGQLIIGTGVNYSKVLSNIKDYIGIKNNINTKDINTEVFYQYLAKEYDDSINNTPLSIIELNNNNFTKVIESKDDILVYKRTKGLGNIYLFTYDLAMEPMKSFIYNTEFISTFIQKEIVSNKYIVKTLNNRFLSDTVNTFLKVIPEIKLPSLLTIGILIFIYIILIGPFIYIFLKRRGKRQYIWVCIPALSIIFVILMHLFGVNTRIKHPITQVVNIINFDNNSSSCKSYGMVLNTNKSRIKVDSIDHLYMAPFNNDNYYRHIDPTQKQNDFPVLYDWNVGIPSITFYKSNIFSNHNFELDNSPNLPKENKIQLDVNYTGNNIEGTVTNNFDFDLEDCLIYYDSRLYFVNKLQSNETKKVEELENDYYSYIQDYYWQNYKKNDSNSFRGKRDVYQKRSVIILNRDDYNNLTKDKAVFIGWTKEKFSNGFSINNQKTKNYEKTLISSYNIVEHISGTKAIYEYGEIKPFMNANRVDSPFYSPSKEFDLYFPIPVKFINVNKIIIRKKSSGNNKSNVNIDYTLIDIINNTGIKIDDKLVIEESDVNKYINSNGLLMIKVVLSDTGKVEVPEIYVEGIVK
ncbi:MAG: hypothetical protein N4A63_11140 [Vallitalea sp.]|nr:hypothetical protein [Vallitalea sp.]